MHRRPLHITSGRITDTSGIAIVIVIVIVIVTNLALQAEQAATPVLALLIESVKCDKVRDDDTRGRTTGKTRSHKSQVARKCERQEESSGGVPLEEVGLDGVDKLGEFACALREARAGGCGD
jgi:hypothetical protein